MPKPSITSSTTHTKRFVRLPHRSVVITMDTRISAPPIVGVPALARCDCGPSSRTDWPIFMRVSHVIMRGPIMNEMTSDVIVASTARSVM